MKESLIDATLKRGYYDFYHKPTHVFRGCSDQVLPSCHHPRMENVSLLWLFITTFFNKNLEFIIVN